MKQWAFLAVLAIGLVISGCGGGGGDRETGGTSDTQTGDNTNIGGGTQQGTRTYTYEQRQDYVNEMNDRLEETRGDLEDLYERARENNAPISPMLQARIDSLRARHDRLAAHLGAVSTATQESWTGQQGRMDDMLDDIQEDISAIRDSLGLPASSGMRSPGMTPGMQSDTTRMGTGAGAGTGTGR